MQTEKIVPLDPELQPWLVTSVSGIPMLKHPLVFNLFHTDFQNERMNKYFEYKKSSLDKALKEKDFESYVWLYERPYRINAFLEISPKMDDETYWKVLGEIWTDSENIWQNKVVWRNLLKSKRSKKEFFMTKEETKEFKKLPNQLKIFRGYKIGKNKTGFSYSLDKETADWFANRFGDGSTVEITIDKKDAFALITRRSEMEIIYLK